MSEQKKVHIQKNSVQETLIIPLYGRKMCNEQFPNLFSDPKVEELISRLDFDFTDLEKKSQNAAYRFGALETAMRQTDLQTEVLDYLKDHPNAAVVNMGCGLDQTAENSDNGTCKMYNIDLPDVMALRNELIPAAERVTNIAADLTDTSWFSQIDASEGAVFFAAGVFYYILKKDLQKLFNEMAVAFPGGKLVFDAAGQTAVKMMVKTWIKEAGISSITECFYVNSLEEDILPWMKHATVTSRGYMLGYKDLKNDPSVSKLFYGMSKLGDGFMKMRIVRMDFDA